MSTLRGVPTEVGTIVADGDLSSSQYRCVRLTANGWAIANASGQDVQGVVQNAPTSGQAARVITEGPAKAVAGAAVAAGAEIMTDNQGRVITWAADTSFAIGTAMEAAGAAGEVIAIDFDKRGRVASA